MTLYSFKYTIGLTPMGCTQHPKMMRHHIKVPTQAGVSILPVCATKSILWASASLQ